MAKKSKANFTKKELAKYYKKEDKYNAIIAKRKLNNPKAVVYGSRALNLQVPKFLHKTTEDWDIFTPQPKKSATELERALDKAYGGDYFDVASAIHKGTYRVKSRVSGKVVADYSKKPKNIPVVSSRKGINVVPLNWIEEQAKKTLKDKASKYRWSKDKDTLNRLKLIPKHKRVK